MSAPFSDPGNPGDPGAPSRRLRHAADLPALLALCALFLALLFLYTAHNRFPYFYHTDEPGKVEQLVHNDRDFHHPQLMLAATECAARLLRVEWNEQRLVEVGRWYSATCSALAVVGLVLWTARRGGWVAGFAAGLMAGLHPLLFELSHYMKEDCGLLFGVVATLLALDGFLAAPAPSWRHAALVGAAAGLAVSAKYIGLIVLGVALATLVVDSVRRSGWAAAATRAAVFLLAAGSLFAAVNARAFGVPEKAAVGLGGEFRQMDSLAEKGSLIQTNYLAKIPRKIAPPVLLGAVGYLAAFCAVARWRTASAWAMVAFFALYLAAIHLTPLAKDRYLLPVLMLMCAMAALAGRALLDLARRRRWDARPGLSGLSGWFGRAVCWGPAAAFLLTLGLQVPTVRAYDAEFGSDSRLEMVGWVRRHLPPDAVIAYDKAVGFSKSPGDLLAIPQRLLDPKRFVVELGGPKALREKGITHVIVSEYSWGNVFSRHDFPGSRRWECRKRYEALFREGRLLWESPRGSLLYLHPGLRIYALPGSGPDAPKTLPTTAWLCR